MRCDCCNERLTPIESVLKHSVLDEYLNTCIKCLRETYIPYKGVVEINDDYVEIELEDDEWHEDGY